MKTIIRSVLLLTSLYLAVATEKTEAVVPPPDGGYARFNTAEGQNALFNLTLGSANTAVGWFSLFSDTDGSFNTATGAGTLLFNTSDENTAFGAAALLFNIAGFGNTAVGAAALVNNAASPFDTPNGAPGSVNTAVGRNALSSNTGGSVNTAVGDSALANNTTGNSNIALGGAAGSSVTDANNVIAIGTSGENVSNSCYIGNIFGAGVNGGTAMPVSVDADGKLGTVAVSARRFKDDIKPMDKGSEAILALKPVTFHYKADRKAAPRYGLVAEDVAAVNPNLVTRNKNAEIIGVQYDQVWNMLLNEFLKEHRRGEEQDCKIQQQETTIAELKSEIRSLAATVIKQASQLQKVSAWIETNEANPQFAKNQ